jgi:hypothetical protein
MNASTVRSQAFFICALVRAINLIAQQNFDHATGATL